MPTYDEHLSADIFPDYAVEQHLIAKFGSITTLSRLLVFRVNRKTKLISLRVAPTTIASGTLKVDLLVGTTVANAVTVLTTKATATAADTPVAATFTTTSVAKDSYVVVRTTSDSSTVTDVLGMLETRPYLGSERVP